MDIASPSSASATPSGINPIYPSGADTITPESLALTILIAVGMLGLIMLLYGHRFVKWLFALTSGVTGGYIAYDLLQRFVPNWQWYYTLLATLGAALLAAAVALFILKVAIFLVGALGGWLVATAALSAAHATQTQRLLVAAGAALVCGCVALAAKKLILIVASSVAGAFGVVVATNGLLRAQGLVVETSFADILFSHMDPKERVRTNDWFYISCAATVALALFGVLVQYKITSKGGGGGSRSRSGSRRSRGYRKINDDEWWN